VTDKKYTFDNIWQTLSKIDCSEHTQKKGNLTFLSWSWAWGILMEEYPDAQYDFIEPETINETMEVTCRITIGDCTRMMWLPVMDYKNKAIKNPDSRMVSDARMRCLVKCMAMFGLGHYIYAGEDLPEPDKKPRINKSAMHDYVVQIHEALASDDKLSIKQLISELEDFEQEWIWSLFDSKQKAAIKGMLHAKPV